MVRDPATASFQFNHTMIRIKDPQRSLDFYQKVIGMDFIQKLDFETFTLYFLAFDHTNGEATTEMKQATRRAREGVLELTHNKGTESDAEFKGYASGNEEPGKGFGHIAISCEDVAAACARFEELGVPFQKRLSDGKMNSIAFIKDPDGYWIEVVPAKPDPGVIA